MSIDQLVDSIAAGPSGPDIAAFFDFDGTLIDGYSAGSLYAHRLKNFELGPVEILHTVRAAMGDTLTEDQFSELMTRGIAGWAGSPVESIEQLGERLFAQSVAGSLFHDAWHLVKAHQRQGHTVVVATSATRFQVAPLARELGLDHVLCTELEAEDGLLTGRISGRTAWGAGKVAAVLDFAAAHDVDLARSHAYANGDEDVPILAAVGHPHPVNPQPVLAAAAAEHGWPVLNFRKAPGRLDPLPAIRTAAMYATLVGAGAAGVALGTFTGSRRRGIDLATSLFAQVGGAVGDIKIRVSGEPHVWAHRPAVFMINHQSALVDLLVTTTVLRGGFTAVAKKEIASVPVLGQLLTMADFAFIDRSSSTQARAALDEAQEKLRAGTSIVISPEGTRSLTPRVGPFRKGGFHLAWQAGVPIVPIVIKNAGELMWRNSRTARTGVVDVVVHEPIPTADWTKADLDECVESLHRLFSETLDDWPGPRAAAGPSPNGAAPQRGQRGPAR